MGKVAAAREIVPIRVAAPAGEACAERACGPRATAVRKAEQGGLAHLRGCETSRSRRYCDRSQHRR